MYGSFGVADQPILALEKVRFKGELIAVVAARDVETAAEAVDRIKVEYEVLPAIFDPREALKPNAIKIHDRGNLVNFYELSPEELKDAKPEPGEEYGWWQRRQVRFGDVEEGFKKADKIYEHTFTTPQAEQMPIEPHVATAIVDGHGQADYLDLEPDDLLPRSRYRRHSWPP